MVDLGFYFNFKEFFVRSCSLLVKWGGGGDSRPLACGLHH
ncbi:hypothetical protein HHE03_01250 [Helicobacter heilmannii]|nr:hypothetical protein HHE03_01250 [Helicobacter heilmannii]